MKIPTLDELYSRLVEFERKYKNVPRYIILSPWAVHVLKYQTEHDDCVWWNDFTEVR